MAVDSESHALHESVPLTLADFVRNLDEEDRLRYRLKHSPRKTPSFHLLFVLSVLTNVVLCSLPLVSLRSTRTSQARSKYAGLARDFIVPHRTHTEYGLRSKTNAARSELWESLDASTGEISLDNTEALALGLPDSTPFFWDESQRSIYLLNAHHSLHCLRKVRCWVTISYHNGTQLDPYSHLVHCLDHLLQNVHCEADDTPLYTASYAPSAPTGDGQLRACRSWEALDAWARERTACFAYVNETQGVGGEQLRRFWYCSEGSRYLEPMRDFFGYADSWWEPAPADADTIPRYWEEFYE